MSKQVEVTREITITMRLDCSPGRPAPACSNPDSPRFSDPGDPPEVDLEEIYVDDMQLDYERSRAFEQAMGQRWIDGVADEALEILSSDCGDYGDDYDDCCDDGERFNPLQRRNRVGRRKRLK